MTVDVLIKGRRGNYAEVTGDGQLVVGAGPFDQTSFNQMSVAGTAYNFFKPKVGFHFIVRGILAFADKSISDASDTVIDLYEATGPTETTISKTLLEFGMAKLTTLPLNPLNIEVAEGRYLNGKTGDASIFMTVFGYYNPVCEP